MSEILDPEQSQENFREEVDDFLSRKREWIDEDEPISVSERYGNLVDAIKHEACGPKLRDYEERIEEEGWESLTEEEYAETVLLREFGCDILVAVRKSDITYQQIKIASEIKTKDTISRKEYDFIRTYYMKIELVFLMLLLSHKEFSKEQIRQQAIVDSRDISRVVEQLRNR